MDSYRVIIISRLCVVMCILLIFSVEWFFLVDNGAYGSYFVECVGLFFNYMCWFFYVCVYVCVCFFLFSLF